MTDRAGSNIRTTATNFVRALAALSLALLASTRMNAQEAHRPSTGDGFLFGAPSGFVTLHVGYSRPNASGDLFGFEQEQFTLGRRAFDAPTFGADVGWNASRRVDLGLSIDGTKRSRESEYRNWEDNNNQPIKQTTSLSTVALTTFLRYNLSDRGRGISNFAWIPAKYTPYVGVGVGALNYDFAQKGDFIDFQTTAVNHDELHASKWGEVADVFGGFSYTLNPMWSLLTEARYRLAADCSGTKCHSSVDLNKDYSEFGRIDLSGFSLNVGTSIRY